MVLYPDALPLHIGVMALLKIARMGHPVLRGVAGAIDDPTAPWVRRLVEDMVETELERLVNQKTEILYDWCQRISCQALAFPPEIAISWCC